ncbi:MAG: helix-turn-helix domain-containing protein [Bacteroidales bacterium]
MQEQYLEVIKQIIEDNIDNESFSVADLARETGQSRSSLHRRLIRLIDKSASDLITEIRLKRAYELLENDSATVSEIAYMVGYSSPSYFNKVFKKAFKVSPGDVQKKGREKRPHLRVVQEPEVSVSTRLKLSRFKEIATINITLLIVATLGVLTLIPVIMDGVSSILRLPEWAINLILLILIVGVMIVKIVYGFYIHRQEGSYLKTSQAEEDKSEKIPVFSKLNNTVSYSILIVIGGLILYNIIDYEQPRKDLYYLEKSIAVLPFENQSSDLAQRWFAEGITDLISSQLTKITGFRVIGRTSTDKFRGREKNLGEIGKALGVNFIVSGAAQKQNDQLRIVVHIIRVKNETQLWSEVYEGSWSDICEIQTDIAKSVASSLLTTLSPEVDKELNNVGTEDPRAWEYYLQAEDLMKNLEEVNIWKAIDKYKQAIALDDKFAQAYAGLAFAYFELTMWDVPDPDPTYVPVAKNWALKALELNENLGKPHYILAMISYHHDWDWEAAEEEFKKGMELDSTYLWGRSYYANFLTLMRRFRESQSISEYTIKLDPLDPYGYLELAFSYRSPGQQEKAIELKKRSLELHPGLWNAKYGLALHYLEEGTNLSYVYDLCEEQLARFNHDLHKLSSLRLGDIGYMLAKAGDQEKVRDILNELKSRIDAETEDTPYLALAFIYVALGESEKAIDYLEKGVEIKEPFIIIINFSPYFEELRSNERFQDLLVELGFEV